MATFPVLLLALLEGAVGAAVLALTALGLSLVFGVMRVINIAHGEFVMLGAITAWFCASQISGTSAFTGFALALVAAPVVAGAAALISDWLVLRRINYDPERTIVATMGLLYIIQQSVLMTYGPDARPVEPPVYFRVQFPWFGYSGYKLLVILFAVALMAASWWVLSRTRLGLYMRATRIDAEMAQSFGVPVRRVYAAAFALGAILAALSGVLIAPIRQAHYLMGADPLLLSFIVVIMGGLGNLRGTLIAAGLIGTGEGMLAVLLSPTLSKIAATLLVALFLIMRPGGLAGSRAHS
jgi:branched-chain amino acid transport system permease protein